jgi:hypothetical protein
MTLSASTAPVHRRIARQVFPVVMLAFGVIGLVGMFTVRAGAVGSVGTAHEILLADMLTEIEDEFGQIETDLGALAQEAVLDATGELAISSSSLSLRGTIQSRFLEWMEQHSENLLSLRLVLSNGTVLLHVVNSTQGTETVANDAAPIPADLFTSALALTEGEFVIVSPQSSRQVSGFSTPEFLFIAPVHSLEVEGSVGVLLLEASTLKLRRVTAVTEAALGSGFDHARL